VRIIFAALAVIITFSQPAVRADFPRLGIFRKKTKEEPPQRVKQLLDTLRADADEKKRAAAAAELKEHDPRTHAEIIPALITAIQRDPSATVRSVAAETIGRLKPVSQQAGVALEQTLASDPVEEVRKAAQKALWDYHLNGYRSVGANPSHPQTAEPPLAKPRPMANAPIITPTSPTPSSVAQPTQARPITTGIGKGAVYPQTIEPPLAKPKTRPIEQQITPPTPSLSVPPLPTENSQSTRNANPTINQTLSESASQPSSSTPATGTLPTLPIPAVPSAPAAPTVPVGPMVPIIPPPS
jgi:hypothetical protein